MSQMTRNAMQEIFNESDCLCDRQEVLAAIDQTAAEISASLSALKPVILTVMNGGIVFAGQLIPRLVFPLEVDYVHATRYGDKTVGETLNWIALPRKDLAGRTVLVVDDILDEGHTLLEILEFCRGQGAAHVYSAVLVNKLHERKAKPGLRADFSCLDVEDRFIFGFGMDYKGFWRNAPGIYAVKGM